MCFFFVDFQNRRGGQKVYVFETKEEARRCLIFKNFSFERKGTNACGEKRIYRWNFYTDEFIEEAKQSKVIAKMMAKATALETGNPQHAKLLRDCQKQPTLIYDPKRCSLKIQFDFCGIDPEDPERMLLA